MKYKEFEFISSSFKCDKNCPYCTAKITKWPVRENKVSSIKKKLKFLKDKGITFKYFIYSGNGEPSLMETEDFKDVVDATRKVNIFDEKRCQSSGNIFYDEEKLDYIKDDFIIEITRVAFDSKEDMDILGYKRDYINSDNFKNCNIRLNYVLLKSRDLNESLEEISKYIEKYPNIKTVSLKTLNTNTMNGSIDNPYSKWIIDNAFTKEDTTSIVEFMNNNKFMGESIKEYDDRYEWNYNGVPITFYGKRGKYGKSNVVYYGGELVDYNLDKLEF